MRYLICFWLVIITIGALFLAPWIARLSEVSQALGGGM